ncbi:TolC family protein [Limnohabitans sp. DCL3]|uniref:TolC family protein n=1 Tax=Limnohabitans sp. DCL3 TaxID=3374103 RepID=UPI003A8398D3
MSKKQSNKTNQYFVQSILAVACWGLHSVSAQTVNFSQALVPLLEGAPRTQAAAADVRAAGARVDEVSRRAWTPQFELNASTGYQRFEKPNAELHEVSNALTHTMRLTQLVSDFGRSAKSIQENEMVKAQAEAGLEAMKQGVVLDALQAYLSVQRAQKVLVFAQMSEKNIVEQARIEDAMVVAGRGYVSNVLQAKAQLAGAQARRVRAEGAQSVAYYRVQAVFGDMTSKLSYEQQIPTASNLPKSLESALEEAKANSLQIKLGKFRSEALTARMASVRAREYAPRVQLLAESRRATAFDGVMGTVKDDRAQIQLNYPINLGLAGSSAVSGAQHDIAASIAREDETRNLVQEQVAIAWRNLQTAQDNQLNLQNQVRLAQEFLNIARQERTVGKRSLLDVLSAETNLLNAQSDLVSTDFDVISASYTLMQAMGRLDPASVMTQLASARR